MQPKITKYQWLEQTLAKLDDDFTKPWTDYPCLEWPWARRRYGYGHLCVLVDGKKKYFAAHRIAYAKTFGELTPPALACHHCDNPPCFRPIHLFAGNHSDNFQDAIRKGRPFGTPLRRTAHGSSKLLPEEVLEIRRLYAGGETIANINRRFPQIGHKSVRKVAFGISWKHLLSQP